MLLAWCGPFSARVMAAACACGSSTRAHTHASAAASCMAPAAQHAVLHAAPGQQLHSMQCSSPSGGQRAQEPLHHCGCLPGNGVLLQRSQRPAGVIDPLSLDSRCSSESPPGSNGGCCSVGELYPDQLQHSRACSARLRGARLGSLDVVAAVHCTCPGLKAAVCLGNFSLCSPVGGTAGLLPAP